MAGMTFLGDGQYRYTAVVGKPAADRLQLWEAIEGAIVPQTRQLSGGRRPPQSGWLDGLGRLKGGRWLYLGVARCAPQFTVQDWPLIPSAAYAKSGDCGRTGA